MQVFRYSGVRVFRGLAIPLLLLPLLLLCGMAAKRQATPVMVLDFESNAAPPTVWVVNIPNENASVALSPDNPFEGKRCLKLHYHFTGKGEFAYLGIPTKVKISTPIHKLRFMLRGDKSGCSHGTQITDAYGETHQYKSGSIDYTGWKETVFDLDAPHETWGGDKNGKLDYPITGITLTISQPMDKTKLPIESDLVFDAVRVESGKSAEETLGGQIAVVSPPYCSDIKGNTRVTVAAPGFKSVIVKCWKQGSGFGSDSTVATVSLDAKGKGAFVFPADA